MSAFLQGELSGPEYERVAQHLAACEDCRTVRDDFQQILEALGRTVPAPPAMAWARYRAGLQEKRAARVRRFGHAWWRWPAPLALATGLAAVLIFLALEGGVRTYEHRQAAVFDEATIGRRLELLRDYQVVERLDLLEDWDILRSLDTPNGQREG
ncbi:MAG: zf-HC2 domain-containing protein [Candidatus Rokuibacteriota bacterium]